MEGAYESVRKLVAFSMLTAIVHDRHSADMQVDACAPDS